MLTNLLKSYEKFGASQDEWLICRIIPDCDWFLVICNLLLCHPNFSPQYSCQITRSSVALIIVQVGEDQTKQHQPSPQPDKGNSPQHYHLCADWRIVSKQKLWQFFVESSLFSALFFLLRMRGYKNCWSWVLCQDAEIMNERIKMLWRHQPCPWYKILKYFHVYHHLLRST